jgi:uncharacterized protein YkwD
MIDLILGFGLAMLVVRGWFRGFVREAMDLAGLVVGVVAAFRLSGTVAPVLRDMGGLSDEVARFAAGVAIFFAVGFAAAVAARALERHARLPGLNMVNRVSGAGLALAWGAFLGILGLSLLAVAPEPIALSSQLESSAVARALTDPTGVPQRMFTQVSGDRVVQTLLSLQEAVGARRVVGEEDDVVVIPAAAASDLERDDSAAAEVLDRLNRSRVDAGVDPLSSSPALIEVAAAYAAELYESGRFAHQSLQGGELGDRLAAAEVTYRIAGENLALAPGPAEVHDGLLNSAGHRANLLNREFHKVGIGVVDGPLGLMTVQVFTG